MQKQESRTRAIMLIQRMIRAVRRLGRRACTMSRGRLIWFPAGVSGKRSNCRLIKMYAVERSDSRTPYLSVDDPLSETFACPDCPDRKGFVSTFRSTNLFIHFPPPQLLTSTWSTPIKAVAITTPSLAMRLTFLWFHLFNINCIIFVDNSLKQCTSSRKRLTLPMNVINKLRNTIKRINEG